MAVFLLKSRFGSAYVPNPATGLVFTDVPASNPFAPWIESLAALNITGGCCGGLYCPDSSVTRQQMAVFLLKTKNGSTYVPPPGSGIFGDVACPSVFCDFIEDLYNQQITGGCQAAPLLLSRQSRASAADGGLPGQDVRALAVRQLTPPFASAKGPRERPFFVRMLPGGGPSMRLRTTLAIGFVFLASAPAYAGFHFIAVKEVFAGSDAHPNAQYVLLQAYSGGQNAVGGHSVLTFDALGAPTGTFTFPAPPLGNFANQMTIFVATPDAATIFNLTVDLAMTPVLSPAGGKVCWDGSTPDDCVAWGSYSVGDAGTPYNVSGGLIPGYAARRRLDICLAIGNLDACDDTNDSASDFITAVPGPITNPGVFGTPPPSTCANGVLEGLERCDDNNTTDGDGCSAVCRIEPDPLTPAALLVDAIDGATSDGNGVFEPGETVQIEPSWTNGGGSDVTLSGQFATFLGAANSYLIINGGADYGTIPPAGTASCADTADCYMLAVPVQARPSLHWDPTVDEILGTSGEKTWTLHIGDSFTDVPRSFLFYPFIENIFHNGVTGGCGVDTYCPSATTLRKQMAVFLLKALLGPAYTPPPATGIFDDVPADAFQPWIEDLYNRQITGGCAGGPPPAPISYCPDAEVKRKQMAVFLLKTLLGSGHTPPPAIGIFDDVPADAFQPWIEELFNLQITGGCLGGPPPAPISYCPENPVTRGQMSAFLVKTFGLLLYGP